MDHQNKPFLNNFDAIPSAASTEAGLELEQIGGEALAAKSSLQTFLNVVRDHSGVLRG
jgi:hypothetical protein